MPSDYETDSDDDYDISGKSESFSETYHLIRFRIRQFMRYRINVMGTVIHVWVLVVFLLLSILTISPFLRSSSEADPTADVAQLNHNSKLVSDRKLESKLDLVFVNGCRKPGLEKEKANAAIVVLARNSEVEDVIKSMESLERHFNQWYHYPWVFLNDVPFNEQFKTEVVKHTKSEVEFGTIESEKWDFEPSIDRKLIEESIQSQGDRRVLYGNLESYHKMCRFYSGHFYNHELVKKRDWYWRVEPNVEFFCDLTYDPFLEMEKHNKKYGFTVMIEELYYTIPSLFRETNAFKKENNIKVGSAWELFTNGPRKLKGKNSHKYVHLRSEEDIMRRIEKDLTLKKLLELSIKKDSDVNQIEPETLHDILEESRSPPDLYDDRMDGEEYNLCHFWSNFEIARTDIFTSEAYQSYFNHLDKSGGFYRERWGDAPVHSLAIGMFLDLDEIHYFRDIGYQHSVLTHCPRNSLNGQLPFEPAQNSKTNKLRSYSNYQLLPKSPNGVGCRCQCPKGFSEVENSQTSCIKRWQSVTSDSHVPPKRINVDFWEEEIAKRLDNFLLLGGKLGESQIVEEILQSDKNSH